MSNEGMEDITFLQEALKRIHSHKGVRGSIIVNADGIPLRSTSSLNMQCCIARKYTRSHQSLPGNVS